jgi:hypothetical protein
MLPQHLEEIQAVCENYGQYQRLLAHMCTCITALLIRFASLAFQIFWLAGELLHPYFCDLEKREKILCFQFQLIPL